MKESRKINMRTTFRQGSMRRNRNRMRHKLNGVFECSDKMTKFDVQIVEPNV